MSRAAKFLEGLIEAGIVGVLLLSPLPFGSVLPWAQAGIESLIALLGALWVVRMLSAREITVRLTPILWPAIAMTGLLGLQLLRPSGSASPYATWESFRLYVAYLGFLLLLGAHLVTRARIVRLVSILVVWGVVLAALGLTNQVLGRAMILWVPKEAYLGRLTSTFVNPNHQALYFSVLLFLALGLLLRPQKRPRFPARRGEGSVAASPAWRVGLPGKVLLAGAMIVIGTALLLTGSRGGVISALVGLLIVLGLSLHGRISGRLPVALGVAVVLFVIYASGFGLDLVVERFSILTKEPLGDLRWPIWEGTLRVVADAPLLGIGLGAFQDGFRIHQPLGIGSTRIVDYAHNDYLQLLAETGLAGLLVMAWALVALTAFVLRRWAVRQDPFVRGLTMGGLGALGTVVAHSATDFGLHMPANALLVVAFCALLPALVTLRAHRSGHRVDLREWHLRLSGWPTTAVAVGALVGCVVGAVVPVSPAIADWYLRRAAEAARLSSHAWGALTLTDLAQARRDLLFAARLEPRNPAVQASLAGVSEELARRVWNYGVTVDGRRLVSASAADRLHASQELFATAYDAYQQSLRYRPRAAAIHDRLAWFLGSLETVRRTVRGGSLKASVAPGLAAVWASDESLIPRAFHHLRQGIQWDPNNFERHRSLALFALAHRGETPASDEVVAAGFRQALTLNPWLLGEVTDHLFARDGDADLLRAAVPRQPAIMLELARHLERRGRVGAATATFEEALSLATGPEQQAQARLAYAHALIQRNDLAGALLHARQALVVAPKNPEVFTILAEIYEGTKQWNEAESALASAASLAGSGESGTANVYRARLASFLSRRGEGERALVLRRQILQGSVNDPWAHLELAKLLEERGEWTGAYREYNAAEELGSRDWTLHKDVARAYARQGHLREAVTAYETAVRLAPVPGELRVELAELYARIGWRDRALEQYRQVLDRQPDHEAARRALTTFSVQPAATAGH